MVVYKARDLPLMSENFFVYIASNKNETVFYTGVTNDLVRRMTEHRDKSIAGFTSRYNISKLLYYEETPDPRSAIEREKQIKKYSRKKKLDLILKQNPNMQNLFDLIADN